MFWKFIPLPSSMKTRSLVFFMLGSWWREASRNIISSKAQAKSRCIWAWVRLVLCNRILKSSLWNAESCVLWSTDYTNMFYLFGVSEDSGCCICMQKHPIPAENENLGNVFCIVLVATFFPWYLHFHNEKWKKKKRFHATLFKWPTLWRKVILNGCLLVFPRI